MRCCRRSHGRRDVEDYWALFIRTSCHRDFGDAYVVAAGYLDLPLIVLKSLLPHESRQIVGGRDETEVLYLQCIVPSSVEFASVQAHDW